MASRPVPGVLRNRSVSGARSKLHAASGGNPDGTLPSRGVGYTVLSYLLAGMAAYGGIGWLVGRAAHSTAFFPAGLLVGLAISVGFVIHRYGRARSTTTREPAETPREELTGDR
jgi:F0F1-type ATP synthase assembly protein I